MAKKQKPKRKTDGRFKKKPKEQPLPGMEDARIPALESVASEYAEIRDHRMELNQDEAKLKTKALRLMREHGKTIYKRNGIEIKIVAGEDELKVRVKHEQDPPESVSIASGE